MGSARAALAGSVAVLRRTDSADAAAKARWVIGVALFRAGHYRWAKSCFELSAAHYRLSGQRINLAQVIENIGLVLKNQGRMAAALEHLDEAMQFYSSRGYWRLRSYCQLHRGICYLRLGQILDARACLMEARALASKARQVSVGISAHNHLGHIYRMETTFDTAMEFYGAALAAARAGELPRQTALALEFLAETHSERGNPTIALPLLDEALAIATQLASHGDLVMEILRRRGEARLAVGERATGLADLRRAIVLCNARGEIREELLAKRAFCLATAASNADLATAIEDVLGGLRRIGDRFEYARTLCVLLEDGRLSSSPLPPWLQEAQTTASHYFASMGLHSWNSRLQKTVGHSVRIPSDVPESRSPERPLWLRTESPRFAQALEAARLAARSSEPTLILGETGSGKEIVARLIHQSSARAARPLIAINCGAIPANLIESELFGHVRGSFTGAERDRAGLFESASGGTVLLDEIGDLPADVQVKLLRFLDHYEFHRIGEHRLRKVDVRILAATHKDLAKLVQEGRFRADLYYRLNVFAVDLPALRHRREDIRALAERFLEPDSPAAPKSRINPNLLRWMEAHDWPGNVRELRNLCRYLVVRCWGKEQIDPSDLPTQFQASCSEFLSGEAVSPFERERLELERVQITRALREGGSILAAARILGIGRNNLARKMHEHGIARESMRSAR